MPSSAATTTNINGNSPHQNFSGPNNGLAIPNHPSDLSLSLSFSSRRDQNVSHVASGFLYNSAAQQKVRADVVFDGALGSSLFDFSKTNSSSGLVENAVYLFTPSVAAKPTCNVYQVDSDFPIVPSDLLVANNAVFAGFQEDPMNGLVSLVSFGFCLLLRCFFLGVGS